MAVLLTLLAREVAITGALGLTGLLGGFVLGLALASPWLAVSVGAGGVASEAFLWRMLSKPSRPRAQRVLIGASVPLLLYGIPVIEETILHAHEFPALVAVLTVLIAATSGAGIAGVLARAGGSRA
jgi:hypothetical protein